MKRKAEKKMGLKITNLLIAIALLVFSITLLFGVLPSWAQTVPFETVMGPGTSSWEVDGVGDPFILKEGTTYKMWYRGNLYWWEGRWWQNDGKIGYAESTDGVNWTNRQLVHSNGNIINDYLFTCSPWIIKEGSTYRMWHSDYYVWVGGDWSYYISHMTSSDGINWSNHQEVLRGSGNFSNYDDYNTGFQSVIREADGTYSMWYSVNQRPAVGVGGPSNIVRATSTDGINWTNKQLVLPRIPGGPENSVLNPDVVRETDGTYTMYYVASSAIYRTRSTDGITWTNRGVILSRSQLSSDITGLDSPHYFRDSDGTEYLYFSFTIPVAGSTSGSREYIGRARLQDILADLPTLDIEANTVSANLAVTVAITDAGDYAGQTGTFGIWATTPTSGCYTLYGVNDWRPCIAGQPNKFPFQINVAGPFAILTYPWAGLPSGTYTFNFNVDVDSNGTWDSSDTDIWTK